MKVVDTIALKEWAVAIDALEAGEQIVIMRKGGIIEETRDFKLESNAFFLFPTYEHQKIELLKDVYQLRLESITQATDVQKVTVTLTSYAEVVADLEVNSQEELNRLFPYHIWTEYFAEERLKWKRAKPLHVLILRIFKLERPIELPILDEYNGCKSWISLKIELPEGVEMSPVLSETEFEAQNKLISELISHG
ncbi:DUF1802 family protein [Paenibacillus psychroresistens]|uniref:DUF1802 family protein n=1 Tax=Paenibacillus psychroresistens TaxID=1778678 RepID=A0A6B8RNC3_9BACL|nr:DUF1802 family protein [Paenibacillus psychroresistens]QGQ97841.1 DUF1802 family protein [Paenibacillus psychroresistens]